MKSKIILVVALLMAIVTTFLFRQYLVVLDNKYKASQKIVSVVVLKSDVKANQLVTKEMLEMKEFSSNSLHPQALKKISDVEGKYATVDLKAGEVLFANRFTDQFKENQVLTRKIRSGYRAVSIGINDITSVTKMIQPEDYVDVVASMNGQTSIILQNVRVLAVGQYLASTVVVNKDGTKTSADYATVTLELDPASIVTLVNAEETGKINLVLIGQLIP